MSKNEAWEVWDNFMKNFDFVIVYSKTNPDDCQLMYVGKGHGKEYAATLSEDKETVFCETTNKMHIALTHLCFVDKKISMKAHRSATQHLADIVTELEEKL